MADEVEEFENTGLMVVKGHEPWDVHGLFKHFQIETFKDIPGYPSRRALEVLQGKRRRIFFGMPVR